MKLLSLLDTSSNHLTLHLTHITSLNTPVLTYEVEQNLTHVTSLETPCTTCYHPPSSRSLATTVGILPACFALTSVWAFLLLTSIAYAEAGSTVLRQIQLSHHDASDDFGVVSLTTYAFGGKVSAACSLAFLTQMLAVVTAQIVKAGEIVLLKLPLPPFVACALPSAAAAILTFGAKPRSVERVNTWLSLLLLLGFAGLVGATLVSGSISKSLLASNWGMLLPGKAGGSAWAVPVFLNMLCFGQASSPTLAPRSS